MGHCVPSLLAAGRPEKGENFTPISDGKTITGFLGIKVIPRVRPVVQAPKSPAAGHRRKNLSMLNSREARRSGPVQVV